MNWNKQNLKVGDLVMLDSDFVNSIEVEIIYLSPHGMISVIEHNGESWQVMTNRLSHILKSKDKTIYK